MIYTKHTIGNSSLTSNYLLLSSDISQNYNNRGVSYIYYEKGKNRRCYSSSPIYINWYTQLTVPSININIGYSSLPIWMASIPGPTKSMFFSSLNYTVYHKDDNPLIANCIPQPSSYSLIKPYIESDIITDWYTYFTTYKHIYLLLDQLDNIYYEIFWDNSSQTYTVAENDDITNYRLHDQIYLHNPITKVFKKLILYGGSLNLVEVELNEANHQQTEFIVRSLDHNTNVYARYYNIDLDSTLQGNILFSNSSDGSNMYNVHPDFILNDQINIPANMYILDKYVKGYTVSQCLSYIGFVDSRLIQPAFVISESTTISEFNIQESINSDVSLDDERIYIKIYDEKFNLIYSNKLIHVNDVILNFDKYWLEVSDKFAAYGDISYIGSNKIKNNRFAIDLGTTKLFIVFDLDYSDLVYKAPDVFEGFRGITYTKSQLVNIIESDELNGFFEFRKPLILNSVSSVGQNMHGFNSTNRADYRNTTTWNKYGAGLAGFKQYNDDTKTYKYVLFISDSAPAEIKDKYSLIISSTNIDIKIYKILRLNKQYINIVKYSTAFINSHKYDNLGDINLLAYNLPVNFSSGSTILYDNMSYVKNINYWVIKGVHSNLDGVRTYINLPKYPTRSAAFKLYRNDEISKVPTSVNTLERYPTITYTGVTRQGQFSQSSDSKYWCRNETVRYPTNWQYCNTKWNYMLPDGTIHTIPFDSNWRRCGYICSQYYTTYNGYHNYYNYWLHSYYFANYHRTYLYKHQGTYEYQLNSGVQDVNVKTSQRIDFFAETLPENIIPFEYKMYGMYNEIHPWDETELNWNGSLNNYTMLHSAEFSPRSLQLGNTLYFYMFINLKRLLHVDNLELGDQISNEYIELVTNRSLIDLKKFKLSGMTITYFKVAGLNVDVFYDRFNDILYDLNWVEISGDDRNEYITVIEYRFKLSMEIMDSIFLKIDNNGNCNFNSDAITDVIEFPKINSKQYAQRIDTSIINDNKRKWLNPMDNTVRSIPILYEK